MYSATFFCEDFSWPLESTPPLGMVPSYMVCLVFKNTALSPLFTAFVRLYSSRLSNDM